MHASDPSPPPTAAARAPRRGPRGRQRQRAEAAGDVARQLGPGNRKLLEDAIALQSRVIEAIAGAARP
jgi:hypothetical protein